MMLGWKVEEGFREMVSLRGSETPSGEEPRDRKTRWEGWGERQKEGGSRERQEQAEKEMGSGSGPGPLGVLQTLAHDSHTPLGPRQ